MSTSTSVARHTTQAMTMGARLRELAEGDYGQWCGIVVELLEKGATLRAVAKMFGISKSKLHRDLPQVRAVAAVHRGEDPAEAVEAWLSHMGHEAEKKADKERASSGVTVPHGTPTHVCPHCGGALPKGSSLEGTT